MGSLRIELSSIGFFALCLSLFYIECLGIDGIQGYPPSINCKGKDGDCVEYQVLHSQKEFEIRTYKSSQWISSDFITTVSYNMGFAANYIRVFIFYRGDNNLGIYWSNITQPILTDIIPRTSYDSTYKTYMLVPKDYQNATLTPDPFVSEVKTVMLPSKKFAAVARIEGYLSDKTIAVGLAALKKSLKGTPWEFVAASTNYTVADYQFFILDQKNDRVNEVIIWFDKN